MMYNFTLGKQEKAAHNRRLPYTCNEVFWKYNFRFLGKSYIILVKSKSLMKQIAPNSGLQFGVVSSYTSYCLTSFFLCKHVYCFFSSYYSDAGCTP